MQAYVNSRLSEARGLASLRKPLAKTAVCDSSPDRGDTLLIYNSTLVKKDFQTVLG
jgi:hypothetical protein